jgi:hypothetical protein
LKKKEVMPTRIRWSSASDAMALFSYFCPLFFDYFY